MVVPNVVVLQAVGVGESSHVILHLVDKLWVLCSWKVEVVLDRHHVGDVVPCEVDKLSGGKIPQKELLFNL